MMKARLSMINDAIGIDFSRVEMTDLALICDALQDIA